MSEVLTPEQIQSDKQQLHDILRGKEYRIQSAESHWPGELWNGFWDWLGRLMPEHGVPRSLADVIAYLVILAVIGFLLYLVFWLFHRYSRDWQLIGQVPLTERELALSHRDYLRQAEAAGAEGSYGEGIRLSFLALLFYGDAQGWLQVEKWKANGEYAFELGRSKPELKPLFQEASRLFEQIYYGKQSAGQAVYAGLYSRVSAALAEGVDRRG